MGFMFDLTFVIKVISLFSFRASSFDRYPLWVSIQQKTRLYKIHSCSRCWLGHLNLGNYCIFANFAYPELVLECLYTVNFSPIT